MRLNVENAILVTNTQNKENQMESNLKLFDTEQEAQIFMDQNSIGFCVQEISLRDGERLYAILLKFIEEDYDSDEDLLLGLDNIAITRHEATFHKGN